MADTPAQLAARDAHNLRAERLFRFLALALLLVGAVAFNALVTPSAFTSFMDENVDLVGDLYLGGADALVLAPLALATQLVRRVAALPLAQCDACAHYFPSALSYLLYHDLIPWPFDLRNNTLYLPPTLRWHLVQLDAPPQVLRDCAWATLPLNLVPLLCLALLLHWKN